MAWMSEYIHKSHNVTVLLYHLVFPAKYRRAVFDALGLKAVVQEMRRFQVEDGPKRHAIGLRKF